MATDAIVALVASMRGDRPQSLDDYEVEEVLNITLALAVELCASNDRIDRLERAVAKFGGTSLETFRTVRDEATAATERQQATEAMLMRVLRILLDPRQPVDTRSAVERASR